MTSVLLSDVKSLRRFDFEQNTKANRKMQRQQTEKSKKKHIAEEHFKAEEQKKARVKVKKNRETSEQVVFLRSLMQPLKVNAKYVFEHKKFKGEFGIFLKDYTRNKKQPKQGKQEHQGILVRFPNELRHNNCRTQMRVSARGCFAETTKDKKVCLLLSVEVEKDWEVNAEDLVKTDESQTTEDGIDYPYPLDYDSEDEERAAREQARREERNKQKPNKKQVVEKFYLLEKTLTEGKQKCDCCHYELISLYDEKEVAELLKRCEKELRRVKEGKTGEQISTRLNRLIIQREEQQEQQAQQLFEKKKQQENENQKQQTSDEGEEGDSNEDEEGSEADY